jgi:SpoVK/Ycf46/Vps4 family AAA+-type ATPase
MATEFDLDHTAHPGLVRLLDLGRRLTVEFDRIRNRESAADDPTHDLFISEHEVASLLREDAIGQAWPIDYDRLENLALEFGLSAFEVDVLLACIAPDIDTSFERIYGFLQDDLSRRRPRVELLLRMLCRDGAEVPAARATFGPTAPLFRGDLLNLPDGASAPLLGQVPWADERIVGHLTGVDDVDGRLIGIARQERAPRPRMLSYSTLELIAQVMAHGHSGLIALTGPPSSGKTESARLMARDTSSPLLVVDVPAMLRSPGVPPDRTVSLVIREARLLGAIMYWSRADVLWDSSASTNAVALQVLEELLRVSPQVNILGGDADWEPPPIFADRVLMRMRLPQPGRHEREEVWTGTLGAYKIPVSPVRDDVPTLAGTYRLTVEQISEAVLIAVRLAKLDGRESPDGNDLRAGARAVSGRRLTRLGQEVGPKATWEQLILPDDSIEQLRELCSTVRTRSQVLEEWGFGSRLTGGRGVTALFAGISGTGKTMAAEVIANELGLPLFRIDLAGVISKWLGETEKNLDRVFDAATDSNAILFFDEADAIFGKRGEVKDSHDRYANLEISYLLQKMESYEGVAILATNMRQQIDEAFLRRLTFTVIFPLPEIDDRLRIWEAVWPAELPRGLEVDLDRMARLKLTGGNIKNIVIAAAHNAAAGPRVVGMAELVLGVRREYQKLGKQMTAEEVYSLLGM